MGPHSGQLPECQGKKAGYRVQCGFKSCSKAMHASCAVAAGWFIDPFVTSLPFCEAHSKVMRKRQREEEEAQEQQQRGDDDDDGDRGSTSAARGARRAKGKKSKRRRK